MGDMSTAPVMPAAAHYALAPSRELASINPNKSVKHALLSPSGVSRFNRLVRRYRHWITVSYWVGITLGTCTLFLPSRVGVWLAIASMPLQLVPSVVSVFVMRYDVVRLVASTYEFWYMTLSNLAVSSLISYSFNDARALVMVGAAVAFETALLVDANHRASRLISFATVLGAITNIAYVACATFGFIQYGRDLVLLRYHHHVLHADDAITSLITTLVVLLVRNGFRKFQHVNTQRIVRCITYRCRVALVTARATVPSSPLPHLKSASLSQLEFVRDDRVFSTADMPFVLSTTLTSRVFGLVLRLATLTSLSGWALALALSSCSSSSLLLRSACATSLCGASLVLLSHLALAHRRLLRALFASFDFVFLSAQLSITHACLADIVGWRDPRALAILASWLWIHWVLTLDAALPTCQSPMHRHIAVLVLLLLVVEHLLAAAAVVVLETPPLELRDRVVFSLALNGRTKRVRVVPVLAGRLVTTLSWALRLLWRLHDARPGELLMLQGAVQYDNTAAMASGSLPGMPWPLREVRILPTAHESGQ